MRVLLVNRFFGNPHVPTGRMLLDVARELALGGHDVHVLTTRDVYVSSGTAGAEAEPRATVHVLWVARGKSRLVSWTLFWLQVCLVLPWMRWDRCLLLTDPPFMSFAAWLARLVRRCGRKAYWWTMDLYPECLIADGAISAGGVGDRLLRGLNELGLRALAGVIVLGRRQLHRLQTYRNWPANAEEFARIVPPWDDRPLPRVPREENGFLSQHGWTSRRVALYAGNLGRGHTYRDLLAAARELNRRGDREWRFVFVCRGDGCSALADEAAGLENVVVMGYVPANRTHELLWSADVHLITMADGWEGIVVPSKLYGVLRTDAPVLFIGPGDADTADEIRRHGAGTVLPNGCGAEAVLDALDCLVDGPWQRRHPAIGAGAGSVSAFVLGL